MTKIDSNVRRDMIAQQQLLDAGWRVAIVWGCALKGRKKHPDDDAFIGELATWLISGQSNTLELSINDSTPPG